MKGNNARFALGILISLSIIAFSLSPQFRSIYRLPPHINMMAGEKNLFLVDFPLSMTISNEQGFSPGSESQLVRPVLSETMRLGRAAVEFKLFGVIPLKSVEVDVLPSIKLIPGGHSIGVVLHSQGVIVVGHSPVQLSGAQSSTPAKDAGIAVGDVILAINGLPVQSDSQVADIIDACGSEGRAAEILLRRGETKSSVTLTPAFCSETRRYRIGLFVRDSAAGVGTLTFYEPKSNMFGALGHVITDNDTNQPIDCSQGKIVLATVSGIQQGKRGQPGEKIGVFIEEDQTLGTIKKNSQFGIYGDLKKIPQNRIYSEPVTVATMSQIELGPAEMLTVVDGQNIERFSVEIQKINLQDAPESKGMVIKVTDDRLLEKTGGIVQGMSGSPILQNGKIIGAVTHVFVHDPSKGYGCFVDWMLMDSGLIPKREKPIYKNLFSFAHQNGYCGKTKEAC